MSATYTLDASGALRLAYEAVTDAPTVLNLTNHSYFDLGGAGSGGTGGHELRLAASRMTPVDADLIPAGAPADVTGTRFDFREPRKVGSGYDHNFALDKAFTEAPVEVAELYDPASGRVLTVATTEPGLQLYTADHLGEPFGPGAGIALETQHFPDSPNSGRTSLDGAAAGRGVPLGDGVRLRREVRTLAGDEPRSGCGAGGRAAPGR
ncbi:hypothetical protein SFUMM280S_10633 [Streptomyces fumanus]